MSDLVQIRDRLPIRIGPQDPQNSLSVVFATGTSIPGGGGIGGSTDGATEATLAEMNDKIPTLGQKNSAESLSVVIASDDIVPVSGTVGISGTVPVSGTVGVTGVATENTLNDISTKLPASLGSKSSATSLSVASASEGLQIAGTDGGTMRRIKTDTLGNLLVSGSTVGTPGTPYAPIRVDTSGTVMVGGLNHVGAATNLSLGPNNQLIVGGTDGTNRTTFRTDSSGNQIMAGINSGAGVPIRVDSNGSVVVAGLNNSNIPTSVKVDSNGGVVMSGLDASNIPTSLRVGPNNQLLVGGNDGTIVRSLRTDASGNLVIAGQSPGGVRFPLMTDNLGVLAVSGFDGSNFQRIRTDNNGQLTVAGIPLSVAQKPTSNSLSVCLSSDQFPATGSLVASQALQSAIAAGLPTARGQQAQSNSISVVSATPASGGFVISGRDRTGTQVRELLVDPNGAVLTTSDTYGESSLVNIMKSVFDGSVNTVIGTKTFIVGSDDKTLATFPRYIPSTTVALSNVRLYMPGSTMNPTTVSAQVRGKTIGGWTNTGVISFDSNGYWFEAGRFSTHTPTGATVVTSVGSGSTAMYDVEHVYNLSDFDAPIQVQLCTEVVGSTATFTTIYTIQPTVIGGTSWILSSTTEQVSVDKWTFQAELPCTVSLMQAQNFMGKNVQTATRVLRRIKCEANKYYEFNDRMLISDGTTSSGFQRGGYGRGGLTYLEVSITSAEVTPFLYHGSITWKTQ